MDNLLYIFIVQFIALFFIIDAIGLVPVFLSLTSGCSEEERHTINKNGVLVAFFILLFFAVLGSSVLDIFGISLAAFKIAGGLLLLLLSIGFVFSKTEVADSYKSEDNQSVLDISVFPLAVPLLSGPAAISMLIIFMKQAEGNILNQVVVILVLLINMLLSYWILSFSKNISKILGKTGINVLTRIFAILLTALACQFIIDGIIEAFRLLM